MNRWRSRLADLSRGGSAEPVQMVQKVQKPQLPNRKGGFEPFEPFEPSSEAAPMPSKAVRERQLTMLLPIVGGRK
jgi:hypothetical protein